MNTKQTNENPHPPLADAIGSAVLGRIAIVEYSLIKAAVELEVRAKGLRNLADHLKAIREQAPNKG